MRRWGEGGGGEKAHKFLPLELPTFQQTIDIDIKSFQSTLLFHSKIVNCGE
jgi:hypothetical protein